MGVFMSTNSAVCQSRLDPENNLSAGGLSGCRHRTYIPDILVSDMGNRNPSATPRTSRCRPVLERLLESLDPSAAATHAETLLREFGSLGALLNAPSEEIDRALMNSVSAGAVIAAARDFSLEALRQEVRGSPVRSDDVALHRYLQSLMGGLREERLHVVFTDRKGGYIADELMGSGSADLLELYFGNVVRRAMSLEAKSILFAHNHPSGVATPSSRDIEVTRKIIDAGQCLGISVIDHLIVTATSVCSMAKAGVI